MMRSLRLVSLSLMLGACASSAPPASAPPAPTEQAAKDPEPAAPARASATSKDAAACFATANATRARFSGEPARVSVKHVLVKWKGSKNAAPSITRSREEACLRAIEVRDKIRSGADFDAVVKDYSDEPGAATRNGSIGSVERKELAKPFADAAFELSIHMLSDVVETEFGFHVITRTE